MREELEKNNKIFLIGTPNAGKSVIFNALTHGHAHTGNWHGVTVSALSGKYKHKLKEYSVTDLPGIYSFNSFSLEEKVTKECVEKNKEDIFLIIADVRFLKRSLQLLKELSLFSLKSVLVLTRMDSFLKSGGKIDLPSLSKCVGMPVICVDALKKKQVEKLKDLLSSPLQKSEIFSEKAFECFSIKKLKESFLETIFYSPIFCLPIFFILILFVFFLTFGYGMPGYFLKTKIEWLLCKQLPNLIRPLFSSKIISGLICDGFLIGVGGVLAFLPQLFLLYGFLIILEQSGYLSILAFMADGIFRKIGLNGRAVFSLLMGFGCTATAVMTTRGLEDKEVQKRAILSLPYISCSAKLPVYLTVISSFFTRPFLAVSMLYFFGFMISLLVSAFLGRTKTEDFILETAVLERPKFIFVFKSLLFQLKQFIIKIITIVTLFSVAVWFLSSFNFSFCMCKVEDSMLAFFCGWLRFLFIPMGIHDWQTAFAALGGIIAKENVAGLLYMFYGGVLPFSKASAVAFCFFILLCSPCVSAIAATVREVGIKKALLYSFMQTGTAFLASYFVYALQITPWLFVGFSLLILVLLLKRFCLAGVYRKRNAKIKKIHG